MIDAERRAALVARTLRGEFSCTITWRGGSLSFATLPNVTVEIELPLRLGETHVFQALWGGCHGHQAHGEVLWHDEQEPPGQVQVRYVGRR